MPHKSRTCQSGYEQLLPGPSRAPGTVRFICDGDPEGAARDDKTTNGASGGRRRHA